MQKIVFKCLVCIVSILILIPLEVLSNSLMKSMTIKYPMGMFGAIPTTGAVRSSELEAQSANKPYVKFAKAQDMEDIWLFENWFYGMKNGIILESGALNGIMYSTSFMYEKFANWTALHVGKTNSMEFDCALCPMCDNSLT